MRRSYIGAVWITLSVVGLSLVAYGMMSKEAATEKVQNQIQGDTQYSRTVIIRDSIDEPLPPTMKDVKYMEENIKPQQIPNADLQDPLILTRMPYSETKKPNGEE